MNSISRLLRANLMKIRICASGSTVSTQSRNTGMSQRCREALNLHHYHHFSSIGKSRLFESQIMQLLYVAQRSKFNKKKGTRSHVDSDDEQDDDLSQYSEDGKRDRNVAQFKTTSLRCDLIIKSALSISRNKIEGLFYDSRIRVNGKKIQKKSATIHKDDEIDVIKSTCPNNPENIVVSRIEILDVTVRDENIVITARKSKSLTIENYAGANAHKSSASAEE